MKRVRKGLGRGVGIDELVQKRWEKDSAGALQTLGENCPEKKASI
jgi:hypothetical protein